MMLQRARANVRNCEERESGRWKRAVKTFSSTFLEDQHKPSKQRVARPLDALAEKVGARNELERAAWRPSLDRKTAE